jgi:hypothetical protein
MWQRLVEYVTKLVLRAFVEGATTKNQFMLTRNERLKFVQGEIKCWKVRSDMYRLGALERDPSDLMTEAQVAPGVEYYVVPRDQRHVLKDAEYTARRVLNYALCGRMHKKNSTITK